MLRRESSVPQMRNTGFALLVGACYRKGCRLQSAAKIFKSPGDAACVVILLHTRPLKFQVYYDFVHAPWTGKEGKAGV
jgi:hypothetical protein